MFKQMIEDRLVDRHLWEKLEQRLAVAKTQLVQLRALALRTEDAERSVQLVQCSGSATSNERLQQLETHLEDAQQRATKVDAEATAGSQNAEAAKSRTTKFEHHLVAVDQIIARADTFMAEFDLRLLTLKNAEMECWNSVEGCTWRGPPKDIGVSRRERESKYFFFRYKQIHVLIKFLQAIGIVLVISPGDLLMVIFTSLYQ